MESLVKVGGLGMEIVIPWTIAEKPLEKVLKAGLTTARKKPELHWRLTLPPELLITMETSALSLWASLTRFLRRLSLLRVWLAVLSELDGVDTWLWELWESIRGKISLLIASVDRAIFQLLNKWGPVRSRVLVGRSVDHGPWSQPAMHYCTRQYMFWTDL